jgi:putative DNA primase/helicase
LGSYEIWSDWVRGALLWLGEADPVTTMEGVRDSDPKLDALLAVLEQWENVIGTSRVSVRDVIDTATKQLTALNMYARPEFRYPDFREALLAVAGEGGAINSKRLGKWLASNQDRVVQGHRLIRAGVSGGIARWRMEAVAEVSADDGDD